MPSDRDRGITPHFDRLLADLGREVEQVVLDVAGSPLTPMTSALRGRAMPRITRALSSVYPARREAPSPLETLILDETTATWDRVLVAEADRLRGQLSDRLLAAIDAGDDDLAELLRMSRLAPDRRLAIARSLDDTRTWVDPNGYRLSDRVWNARQGVRQAIDQELRLGIVRGTSPVDVAARLERFLTPKGARARSRVVLRPGDEPGTGSYSARRLARTELTRARAQATVEAASRIPTTRGMKWNLSNRHHPGGDECDVNAGADRYGLGAGVYPLTALPRLPQHPMCLCFWSTSFPSREESDRIIRARYGLG